MPLVTIQGSMVADANAAAAFRQVDAHYGGRLVITAPYGANRSRAQQQKLRNDYLAGRGAYAAPPGNSMHERGLAFDVNNWASFPDLRAVMARYGFTRDPSEAWHYNYTGKPSTAGLNTTPLAESAPPELPEDDDMRIIWTLDPATRLRQTAWFVGPGGLRGISTPQHLNLLQRIIRDRTEVDNLLPAEMDILATYLNPTTDRPAVADAVWNTRLTHPKIPQGAPAQEWLKAMSDNVEATRLAVLAKAAVDPAPLVSAVTSAVQTAIAATGVKVDAGVIAKAVEAQLADEFAKVPTDVANEAAKRLTN